MKHLEKLARKDLGDILVDEGLITKGQLLAADQERSRTGDPLGAVLIESRILEEDDLARIVALEYQLPFVELPAIQMDASVAELFTEGDRAKFRFVPLDRFGSVVTIAVAEMPSVDFLHGVKSSTGLLPFLYVAMLRDIDRANGRTKVAAEPVESAVGPVPGAGLVEPDDLKSMEFSDDGEDESDGSWQLDPSALENAAWANIFDVGNESVLKEQETES